MSSWRCLVLWSGLLLMLATSSPRASQGRDAPEWTARKCSLYRAAVQDALGLLSAEGLRAAFLDANASFIEAGCTGRDRICAVTPQETALADMLAVMTMNESMASTFVPFGCPAR